MVVLGVAAVETLLALDRQRPPAVRAAELSYLPKGEYLKVAVLGYRQMVADLIWIKALQHLGERKQTKEGYQWAYHAVDVLTELDPKFTIAYQVGGTILGVWAGLVHESIALLTKGMLHNPDTWQFPFFLGYDYYYELHDPATAAKYFRMASMLQGSPAYLPKLAARMTVEAGDPDAALEFLERLYRQVQDERLRESLVHRMKEVMAERDVQRLEQAVAQFKARYGKLPGRLEDLVTAGAIVRLPEEPLGGIYQLRIDGTVVSTGLGGRLRVHQR